jgi:hypothetical protein
LICSAAEHVLGGHAFGPLLGNNAGGVQLGRSGDTADDACPVRILYHVTRTPRTVINCYEPRYAAAPVDLARRRVTIGIIGALTIMDMTLGGIYFGISAAFTGAG